MRSTIELAKSNYRRTYNGYRAIGFDEQQELGSIWRENVKQFLVGLIENQEIGLQQIMGELNKRAFYDFTVTTPLLKPSLRWYQTHIKLKYDISLETMPQQVCESKHLPDERCLDLSGRRLSSDFLYRLSQVMYLRGKNCLSNGSRILEIGAGYGALARTILLSTENIRYVLLDIPETLFFAEIFLGAEFPEKKFHMIGADSTPESIEEADILLVPTGFRNMIDHQRFDLVINTNSLGEMPTAVSSDLIEWLNVTVKPVRMYSLNRFLNRVSAKEYVRRAEAVGCNYLWGPKWKIVDWEVNPHFEQCPFYVPTVTRNLCLIMEHTEPTSKSNLNEIAGILDDIELQDWFRKPYWDNYVLKPHGTALPMMSKINPDLTPDMTMHGTLFSLWNILRTDGITSDRGRALELFVAYLQYLGGDTEPFEDILCFGSDVLE